MKPLAIDPQPHLTYIDHLMPLCDLVEAPLLCIHEEVANAARLYYPPSKIIVDEGDNYALEAPLQDYDTLIYVERYRKRKNTFLFHEHMARKNCRSLFALHGNSNKNRGTFWVEGFVDEDIVLVYGQHMLDFLEEKGVRSRLSHLIVAGNYRLAYYEKHKAFFDEQTRFFDTLKKGRAALLYAPTWISSDKTMPSTDATTFFDAYPYLFDHLPPSFCLFVKLHPLLSYHFPNEISQIKEKYSSVDHLIFIDDFPFIYPLLDQMDCYIGDYSSIGYDFLAFDRPLLFLQEGQGAPLECCGTIVSKYTTIYDAIEKSLSCKNALSSTRKEVYHYVFGSPQNLRQEIENAAKN